VADVIYVYSTPDGRGRALAREPVEEPWPMLLVAVFDDDQDEEAAEVLHWSGGQPDVA
jgi:hypothetical protein